MTVSGLTITRAWRQPGHRQDRMTQKTLSAFRSDGRGLFRFRTATCCRRARISVWSAARSAKISMILCMPERVSSGDAKFQGFCDRWNKWEGHPCRAGAGGDDGAGPGAGASRPCRAHALPGRAGATPRHRLTLHQPSDIADRPGRLPADGKLRPPPWRCSRIVRISPENDPFRSISRPGADDIQPHPDSVARSKTPQRTCLHRRRVRCRQTFGEQGIPLP